MRIKLQFTKEALFDYKEAFDWYADIDKSLSNSFRVQVDNLLDKIIEAPNHFPIVESQTRRAILNRFPYGIFFILEQESIVITAILHHKREPRQ